jgi:competence protein ComEA
MTRLLTLIITTLLACSAWGAGPVNINTASAEEIAESLKGIGLSKATQIVAYREQNGSFTHIDELINVKGVGMKTVDRNKDLILLHDMPAETGN